MKKIAPLQKWYKWWGGKEVFQQAPLYPYLLALFRWISDDSMSGILCLQLTLGAMEPLILFFLATCIANERVGLVAAAIGALYGPLLFYQGTMLRDWIPPLLEPLALLLLLKAGELKQRKKWVFAGLLLGLSALAKERILMFFPFVFLWILLKGRKVPLLESSGFLLAGLFLSLGPLMMRNIALGVSPFSFSNRGAEFFIEGNAADAYPVGLKIPPSMAAILERSDGKFWAVVSETISTYQGDWKQFFYVQGLKFRALLDPMEIPNNLNFYYGVEISPVLRFTFRYHHVFPFAILGLFLSRRKTDKHLLLFFYVAVTFLGLMISNISSRQRLGIVSIFIVYAAVAFVWLWDNLYTKKFRLAIPGGLFVVLTVMIQQLVIPIQGIRNNLTYAVHPPEYLVSAYIYSTHGEPDRAVNEMVRLREKVQKLAPGAIVFLQQIKKMEQNYKGRP